MSKLLITLLFLLIFKVTKILYLLAQCYMTQEQTRLVKADLPLLTSLCYI